MAKRKNKADPKAETQEIVKLRDYQEARASFEPLEEEEAEEEAGEERLQKRKVPKAVYRVGIILLVLVLGLALWLNRDRLDPEGIANWVKLQFIGSGEGDGFPVSITGSSVSASNFTSYGGNAMALSDTALTVLSPTGRELLSLRHSLNQPVLRSAYGRSLLYNAGSTGYTLLSGTEVEREGASDRDLLAGDVAQNGRYALGVQGSDGASELNVYQQDGTLQFHYLFAQDYITAIALNYDGTHGLVCTVGTEKGEMVSKVTVFDFNQAEPAASCETRDNFLLDAYWTEGGDLYAVGSSALLRAGSADYGFTEYGYDGRQPTAYRLDQGRLFLSVSAYEHAGPCTLLLFQGQGDPVRAESSERIVALSSFGSTVGALTESTAVFYDGSTGEELGRAEAGSDAKSIAMMNEKTAYVLGVSEIRTVGLEA